MEKQPFVRLQDPALFCLAHLAYGTVVWPGNIDISPETLYDGSTAIGRGVTQKPQPPRI